MRNIAPSLAVMFDNRLGPFSNSDKITFEHMLPSSFMIIGLNMLLEFELGVLPNVTKAKSIHISLGQMS